MSLPLSPLRTVHQSFQEYARGVAGGLIFALPLLYTMEVWWAGFLIHPERLILYMGATFLILLGYNRYAGLRDDASWLEVAIDSVEEMGLGLVIAAFLLWILGRLNGEMAPTVWAGKIVMEGMTVAIGVSVGTAQLGVDSGEQDSSENGEQGEKMQSHSRFLSQVALGLCGAILFAGNVAPTEEILVLAAESSFEKLLFIALLSIGLGAGILFFSEFRGTQSHTRRAGLFEIVRGIVTTYAVALFASALALWFFGQLDNEGWPIIVGKIVILGFAASLGASAGRLLLQADDS